MGRFLRWLGIQTRAETAPDSVLPPARTSSGVSLDRALSVVSAYRAVSILATAASQLELTDWRRGQQLDPADRSFPALVRLPDPNQSQAQFVKRLVVGLAGTGNAYLRKFMRADGLAVESVQALNPLTCRPWYQDGRKFYDYSDTITGRSYRFNAAEVHHLRLMEVPGHVEGLGPVQSCRSAFTGAMNLRDYADNWFTEGAIPTGVLSTDQHLNPDQAEAYKKRWHDTQTSRDVAVLGQGLNYAPIILKPEDAQFLESQQFSVTDIARLFGIPAAYLLAEVNGSSMTYMSLEMADTQFVRYTLMQYLTEIEAAMTAMLPHGHRARFDVSGLLRPDAQTRANVQKIYHEIGALSAEEIRKAEGYGPMPDGLAGKPAPAELTEGEPNA